MTFLRLQEKYNILYFFRNTCSPLLAELFAKELKTSKYIQEKIEGKQTLFDILNSVNNKGKKKANKKSNKTQGGCKSGAFQINNLNLNKEILEKVSIKEVLEEELRDEVARKLSVLEVKFLLYVLTNHIFDFAFNGDPNMKEVLKELQHFRNSDTHQDKDKHQEKIWRNTKYVHEYLEKDPASFPKLEECFHLQIQNKILSEFYFVFLHSCL